MAKRKGKKKKKSINARPLLYLLIVFGIFYLLDSYSTGIFKTVESGQKTGTGSASKDVVSRVKANYSNEADRCATEFNLPASYLKSLIILESSGKKPAGSRFEKHVYQKLKKVRAGSLKSFEHITQAELKDASDEALKNLATSWGPFQIMGYKCIHLKINLSDLRNDKAIYYGSKWINMTYGDYLRKGKYRDGFHIHNTGHPYPTFGPSKTYDPKYVPRGLRYMKSF